MDQFRPDLGPLHFFLDHFRTGSRPTTLWYQFSISLICRPLCRLLKWRVQIFSYSVKGVQMLRKYRFWGKNLGYSLGSKSAWLYMAVMFEFNCSVGDIKNSELGEGIVCLGEGSGGKGGGKWGKGGREVGEKGMGVRGREVGNAYPPVHPRIGNLRWPPWLLKLYLNLLSWIERPIDLNLGRKYQRHVILIDHQGPVVQSVVSLTSSLRVISLTILVDSMYNILIFFCWKNVSSFCTAKATHIFSAKNFNIFAYHLM